MARPIKSTTTPMSTGTVDELVATSGSLYLLLLVSRSANSSLAREARRALHTEVMQRIETCALLRIVSAGVFGAAAATALTHRMTRAIPLVFGAIAYSRPRSPSAFSCWLDQTIDDALGVTPHDTPPAATCPSRAWRALHHLPMTDAAREELLREALASLPVVGRCVLMLRDEPGATWRRMASAMGMTTTRVRAVHRHALDTLRHRAAEIVQARRAAGDAEPRQAA